MGAGAVMGIDHLKMSKIKSLLLLDRVGNIITNLTIVPRRVTRFLCV